MTYSIRSTALATAAALALTALPAAAQSSATVTSSDMQRLELAVADAQQEVANLRTRDAALAERLTKQLDELGEEVIYLKVRARREQSVPRSEYSQLRDRIDDLRNEARAKGAPAPRSSRSDTGSASPAGVGPGEIPVGQEIDVRLQSGLNSGRSQVEDRFQGTTLVDLARNDRVLVPAGSTLRGVVTSVDPATRTDRKGSMTLAFDQITVNGRNYPIRATVTQALESEGIRGETGRIATGAGVGAIIGGILGGFKGVLAGILIGGGGTIVATEGKDVDLPAGTILRLRFDEPLNLQR